MSNWFKRIREYDRVVGEREAAKTALNASRAACRQFAHDIDTAHKHWRDAETENVKLRRDLDTLKLNLANAREENGRLGRKLTEARADAEEGRRLIAKGQAIIADQQKVLTEGHELIEKLDADNAQLSGQLADAKAQLASYTLAEAIDDETRAKRYYDGLGDE